MSAWDDELINRANKRNAGQLAAETKTKIALKELRAAGLDDLSPGTHYVRCPNCGWDKERSNDSLEVTRALTETQWKWKCHYCGISGATDGWQDDEEVGEEEQRALKLKGALRIWDECEPISSCWLPGVYLSARRIELPPNPDAVLRWHWHCPFGKDDRGWPQRLPCMVALFRDVLTDQITGIHRTHIVSAKHGEADRRAYGELTGSAIKLWPLGSSEDLAVGEGIENVLSAIKLGQAKPPAWAMTVANNLRQLPVIAQVKRLTILADNDRSTTGERVARACRRGWQAADKEVTALMTTEVGSDFNDLLTGGDHEG